MTSIYKYIINLAGLLLILTFPLRAQSVIWPSALRVGTDLSRLTVWALDPVRKQYEFNADIDLYKYFIAFDYGNWQSHMSGSDFGYLMNGNYFRAGIDYNFIYSDIHNHVIFFGLRYCQARFNETFNYHISDPYYGSYTSLVNKNAGTATWFEMKAGIKAHIWKGLYMGWNGSMRIGLKLNSPGNFSTYEIPGYGITAKNSHWGLDYSIYYRFVFRKKPRILPKQDKNKDKTVQPKATKQ